MEKKFFSDFEIKADEADDTGNTIVGYGSVFGNVDQGGDVLLAGAFTKSLASGRKAKMLWQHSPHEVLGVWTSIVEDEKGLKVEGRFANTPRAQEAKELVRIGALDGLSIGYRTIEAESDTRGYRLLKEVDLYEVSLVTFPMNEQATIDSIKAADMTKRQIEEKLRDAGFSKSVAQALLSGGFEALQSKRDAQVDDLKEVMALFNSRINLLQ